MTTPPLCLHCELPASLVTGREIYPHREDLWSKRIWRCACGARCGCHKDSDAPLGRPADQPTRDARMTLHQVLDPIWRRHVKDRKGARDAVYAFLSRKMGLPPAETHVGLWSIDQCRRALALLSDARTEEILGDERS